MNNSHGIISFKIKNDIPCYLVCQRRDSVYLLQLLRRFHRLESNEVIDLISKMTSEECQRLLNNDFDVIWNDLFIDKNSKIYITEERRVRNNFNSFLKNEIIVKALQKRIEEKIFNLDWGFPKGRRKPGESGFTCAKREWEEEMRIDKQKLSVVQTIPFYYELNYENKTRSVESWLARLDENIEIQTKTTNLRSYISSEIGKIIWGTLDELKEYLKPNLIRTLESVDEFVQSHLI